MLDKRSSPSAEQTVSGCPINAVTSGSDTMTVGHPTSEMEGKEVLDEIFNAKSL